MAKKKINRVPDSLDLELYAGDGVSIRLSLNNSAGDPITITGTFAAHIRETRSAAESAAEFDTAIEEDGVVISLTGEQTQALVTGDEPLNDEPFKGFWDLQWTPEGGEPKTLIQGEVECSVDVTR